MANFLRIIQHLLPRTKTWSLVKDRPLRQLFDGIGDGLLTPAKGNVDGVWSELDPETTESLTDWENQFGIWEAGEEADRRAAIAAEWSDRGGQSPRHLQDIIQAHGFDIYIHGWRASNGSVRDPRDYAALPFIGQYQCGRASVVCRARTDFNVPRCNRFLVRSPGYIVNECLDFRPPPPIPTDSYYWRYFIYWGGETFGTSAEIPAARLLELKRLLIKHCPGHLWIVLMQEPAAGFRVFSDEFDLEFS
jgi:hypothetical protein